MLVTVDRKFSIGGRELGKRLSDALQIPCYDEIIKLVTKEHGLDADYVARMSECDLRAAYPLTIGRRLSVSRQVLNQSVTIAVTQRKRGI